jgi:two-component system, chemotaxis family, protein-glutamate methylesterase/glutaminase
MNRVLRVLIVDDSAYVRKVLRHMLARSPFIEVVGAAHDGVEALELAEQLNPDVITTDLMMPELDGVGFVRAQMARRPIPILIVSIASESGELVLAALEAGAIDVVQKPTALATEKVFEIAEELIAKVKSVASVPLVRAPQVDVSAPVAPAPARLRPQIGNFDLVVIGISTGGPHGLKQVIPGLSADFSVPVAIVLHMPVGYTELYAQSLHALAALDVVEAREGDIVQPGKVLLAPAGHHLTLRRESDGTVVAHLSLLPLDTPHRPSVDVLFQSAAQVFGARVLGIVMTGMGADGLQGAAWIKAQGGSVWTEAEETCIVYGMPRAVVEAGLSDRSVSLTQMAQALQEVG